MLGMKKLGSGKHERGFGDHCHCFFWFQFREKNQGVVRVPPPSSSLELPFPFKNSPSFFFDFFLARSSSRSLPFFHKENSFLSPPLTTTLEDPLIPSLLPLFSFLNYSDLQLSFTLNDPNECTVLSPFWPLSYCRENKIKQSMFLLQVAKPTPLSKAPLDCLFTPFL